MKYIKMDQTPWEKHGVVPDVIDNFPSKTLQITYENGVEVDRGNKITPTVAKDPPKVTWDAEPNSFYLLCMTDPDAPSRKFPKAREWHHWLIGNIPGNDISKGEVLSEYIGAAPPPDTGYHRYVFLIYKQPSGKLKFDEKKLSNKSAMYREKFSIRKLAQKYKLGDPVAGNFFQAKYDDYVPKIYKQIGA